MMHSVRINGRGNNLIRLIAVMGICLVILTPSMVNTMTFGDPGFLPDAGTSYEDVTMDLNGGDGGTWIWTLSVYTGDKLTGPSLYFNTIPEDVPVRKGYTFMGWSMANDDTPDFQPGDHLTDGVYVFVEKYVIYAIWEENAAVYPDLEFLSDPIIDGTITYRS